MHSENSSEVASAALEARQDRREGANPWERWFSVLFVLIPKESAFFPLSFFKESTYLIKTKAKLSHLVLRKKKKKIKLTMRRNNWPAGLIPIPECSSSMALTTSRSTLLPCQAAPWPRVQLALAALCKQRQAGPVKENSGGMGPTQFTKYRSLVLSQLVSPRSQILPYPTYWVNYHQDIPKRVQFRALLPTPLSCQVHISLWSLY